MAITHVPVTNYYDVYDLWAAGLLYAHGKLCEFTPHLSATIEERERIVRSWNNTGMTEGMYTYRTED